MSKKSMAARRQMREASAQGRAGGGRPQVRGRTYRREQKRRPWGLIGAVVGVVAAFVIVVVVLESTLVLTQDTSVLPAPKSLVSALTNIPVKTLDAVKGGSISNPPVNIPSAYKPVALSSKGLPELAFVGAEYCPYCALQRWSLIVGLSRFGTWSNLHTIRSSVYDSPSNLPTFTFAYSAKYTSRYLVFLPREYQSNVSIHNDGTPYKRFQSLPKVVGDAFVNIGDGGYPFLDYAGKYASVGSEAGVTDVPALQNLSWDQVLQKLSDPTSTIAQEVLGGANYVTAATCLMTSQKPGSVCHSPMVKKLEATISASQ